MYNKDKEFLKKRRDRAIAIILSHKERECDEYLPDRVAANLRSTILDQINDVCDFALDLLDDDIDFNEEFLDRLYEIMKD